MSTASISGHMYDHYYRRDDDPQHTVSPPSFESQAPNLIFLMAFVAFAPATRYATARFPSITQTIVPALALCTGSLLRCLFAVQSFSALMVGNAIVGLAQPFVFGNSSAIAMYCVGIKRQGVYLGLVYVVTSVGTAYGYLQSTWLVRSSADFAYYFPRVETLYLCANAIALCGSCLRHVTKALRAAEDDDTTAAPPDTRTTTTMKTKETTATQCKMVGLGLTISCLLNGMSNSLTIMMELILADPHHVFVAGVLFLVVSIPFPLLFGRVIDLIGGETGKKQYHRGRLRCLFCTMCVIAAVLQTTVLYLATAAKEEDGRMWWLFYASIVVYGIVSNNSINTVFLGVANAWNDQQQPNASKSWLSLQIINELYTWVHTLVTLVFTLCFVLAFAGAGAAHDGTQEEQQQIMNGIACATSIVCIVLTCVFWCKIDIED